MNTKKQSVPLAGNNQSNLIGKRATVTSCIFNRMQSVWNGSVEIIEKNVIDGTTVYLAKKVTGEVVTVLPGYIIAVED